MALTGFQRDLCRLLAGRRRLAGESYIAGGVALGIALESHRTSRDLDIFHDTTEAVAASWDADRQTLEHEGYQVSALRERPGFVQAMVVRGDGALLVEWLQDSAYRFFPLVEHDELGLTLHPFDLAVNKVLALVGRLETRDWVDAIFAGERLQSFGYLAWAACGKDPGFTPQGLVAHARRSGHYSHAEISALAFDGVVPDAADLGRRWHLMLDTAEDINHRLPTEHVGEAVLNGSADLYRGAPGDLDADLRSGQVRFHAGRIGGALPQFR